MELFGIFNEHMICVRNLVASEEKIECSKNNLPPIKKNQDIQRVIYLQ